ncbi:Nnf1-domain-containing protein [Hypoxylon sp. NC0597]|nr:Nnf1-domain-containing protein [Hypoxylon sp. NC0597]
MAAVGDGQEATASQQQGPASPPLPARHTPLTPGLRASRFQQVLDSSLSHTLAKISWENFAACYPTIAAQSPAVLRAVQKQMVDRLGALCKKEFDSVLQGRNVVAKLNELESLVSEAERRRDEAGVGAEAPVPTYDHRIWRTRDPVRSPIDKPDTAGLVVGSVTTSESPVLPHMLPPDQILAAHLAPHLAQQQSQLNAKLQTVQAHNAKLFSDIQKQRAEMESLMRILQKVFEDIDGANGQIDDVADDLAKETRTVEAQMTEP